jgi:hypothetical protein
MVRFVLLVPVFCACAASAGDIYRWENKDATVTYSDQTSPAGANGSSVRPEVLPPLHVVPLIEFPVRSPEPEPGRGDRLLNRTNISLSCSDKPKLGAGQ